MEKLQKMFLTIGIILLMFIPLWYFFIVPGLEKMPVDYQYLLTYAGRKSFFDLETKQYIETISRSEREDKVIEVRGDTLVIENRLVSYDVATNTEDFKASGTYGAHRITRKNVAGFGEAETGYFKFPLHVQKTEYIMHSPEIQEAPTPVVFEKVELVKGLKTYKFNYFVEPSDKTRFYPHITGKGYLVEGEERGSLWVEPKSGHIVYFNKEIANDLLNQSTREKVATQQELSLEFTDETITNQVRIAQNKKQQIILYEIIIPLLLAVMAMALLIVSYLVELKKDK